MVSRLNITDIRWITQGENRQVEVAAVCAVRGEVLITFSEGDARWLRADLTDKVNAWNSADGERSDY